VIHFLNYFEAAVQFLGTLMASAFHSNPSYFKERGRMSSRCTIDLTCASGPNSLIFCLWRSSS
jgi:hypothetical protein